MYLTETAQAADVFLPLSAYMEGDGHLTNWFGLQQKTNPIGEPANGLRTLDILNKLSTLAGYTNGEGSFDSVSSELQSLIEASESSNHVNGSFPTTDGKAHFVLYSDQIQSVSANAPQVLEVDARVAAQMKLISS
jgi:NADH dehydrogenase/NADH:ubiquinone oxidoreductase subunit G